MALLREAKLAHFAALRAARRARVRAAFLREALRIKLLRARRRRAGRRVAGFVIMAQARLARRHAGRAVRADTLYMQSVPWRYGVSACVSLRGVATVTPVG